MSPPPPRSLCLLRTSALGDVTHVVPLLRELQAAWPGTAISWVIGKLEHKLLGDLTGVEFIVFDKSRGWQALAELRRQLAGRRFDVLLHLQVAFRANLMAALIGANRRIGYDRARSKEGHSLVIGERIPAAAGQHVLDAIGSFVLPLGLARSARPRWELPIPESARAFAAEILPGEQPSLLISPCSSHPLRNWGAEGYARIAEHAVRRHGFRVLLCGGRSELERRMGDAILAAATVPIIDLIGRDTLKQLLALLERASVVLTPDSGPMHMANAVGTPVIGLHAATNPERSGPYHSRALCVNRYDDAARQFLGKPAHALPWGRKIEQPGVMDLIGVEDVIQAFERAMAVIRR